MDISLGLITQLVDEDKYSEVQRSGITQDFLSEDYISVFNYIVRHRSEYGSVPSRDAVKNAFPNFEFGRYKEPLEYFISALKEQHRQNIFDANLSAVAEVYREDSSAAEALLRETLARLQVTGQSHQDVSLSGSATDRINTYLERQQNPGADGILSGWDTLDYQTLGWHPEEFIVLVGEKYTGKSWTMLWLAYQALLQGERVLFLTKEMSTDAITRRFDSVWSSVPFDALRRGELTHIEFERYEKRMAELAASNLHFVVARNGVSTIEDIEAKAIETDASIIFADSVYLFLPDSRSNYSGETAKRLAVSQKCKDTATRLGVPFVVSVQAGRKKTKSQKPDLDNIEWSNAFSQDAETVLYIHKEELDKEVGRMQVHLLKSRDGDTTDFFINTNFENMLFDERVGDSDEPSVEVFEEDEQIDFNEQATT